VRAGFRRLAFALLALAMPPAALAATVYGHIDFVEGSVNIVDSSGKSRIPQVKGTIEEGDTIITGKDGELHAVTEDQAVLAVRPNTKLRIDAYQADGDEHDKTDISLVAGALRYITGWIGKYRPANYRIRTSNAVVGIRGTDHETLVVEEAHPGEAGPEATPEPGTYDKVNSGSTFLRNEEGEVVIAADQVGFADAGGKKLPRLLERIPDFYRPTPNEQRIADRKQEVAEHIESRLKETAAKLKALAARKAAIRAAIRRARSGDR
jgi:hypothetical protein